MNRLLQEDGFLKTIFDAIPLFALIVDSEGRVHAINEVVKNLFGITDGDAYLKMGGDILHCIHTKDSPRGCGFGPACKSCAVRNAAMKAIAGSSVHRFTGYLEIEFNNQIKMMNLLVSSAPVVYKEQVFAIVIIEDVSLITQLQGLLPICASCKRIRDEQGHWNYLEKYIEEHSEAQFTHDICPDCSKRIYGK